MTKFIKNSFYLGVIILIVSALLEIALLYQPNTYSYKHKYVMSHLDDIRVLIVGNSLLFNGLNPALIGSNVFNSSVNGMPVYYCKELIKQYVPQMDHIETVIVPLDYSYFLFGRDINDKFNTIDYDYLTSTYRCMFYKYMGVKTDIWYWPELLNSKMKFMTRFFNSEKAERDCDELGCNIRKLSSRKKGWEYKSVYRLVDMSKQKDTLASSLLYEYYCNIADVVFNKDAKLILLSTPVYKTNYSRMNNEIIKEMYEFVKELEIQYPNVKFYDLYNDPRFDKNDFYDSRHLSEPGTIKLSSILKQIINQSHT